MYKRGHVPYDRTNVGVTDLSVNPMNRFHVIGRAHDRHWPLSNRERSSTTRDRRETLRLLPSRNRRYARAHGTRTDVYVYVRLADGKTTCAHKPCSTRLTCVRFPKSLVHGVFLWRAWKEWEGEEKPLRARN